MGELIEVSTLTDLAPGRCRQVDAGGRPVAVFNVNGTISTRSTGRAPIGAVPWGKASWTARWSPVPGTAPSLT